MSDYAETESWLANYLILEKRIDALVKQAQKPRLLEMALKMGPSGIGNMAQDLTKPKVDGGRKPTAWFENFGAAVHRLAEQSAEISEQIADCVNEQLNIQAAVRRAGLNPDERLYVEQRYFAGMRVKEMERDGCKRTQLGQIKQTALVKIAAAVQNGTKR